jgi:Holliday junction resolvase RusA-like endonuclease
VSNQNAPRFAQKCAAREFKTAEGTIGQGYRLFLKIDGLPKILTNGGGNWRRAHFEKRKWKHLVHCNIYAPARPLEPLKKAKVTFTRHSFTQPDFDNLAASFKACQDALVEAGIIVDDSPDVLTATYCWNKAKPKRGFITIRLEEAWNAVERT